MKSSSPVFTLFLFPLITCYREISFHLYIAFLRLLGSKKHVLSILKRKSDGYETKGTSWNRDLFHLLLSSLMGFFIFCFVFFFNTVILWVFINYPKPILKELFNLQLWSCTFFQDVTVLLLLYTSFKFSESFAYCVPLSVSLRTGFSQNKNTVF